MWSCFRLPKDREKEEEEFRFFRRKAKEKHFLENGGLLLEEMIKSFDGRPNPIRSFSQKELQRATNNYHQDGVLHQQHWSYKLYKGTYEDRPIWVKKFPANAPWGYIMELYINEVAVASQMSNHKNVLKLLGCCLETQVPTLVYEFAANGCLSNHIFAANGCLSDHIFEEELSPSKKNSQLLSWESKLRIATEIADAVAYLHKGTSKSIVHRLIISRNILLDQHYVAKLFNLGYSISIPLGETHVDANRMGNFATTAPESAYTGRYTEKSDVYSFGVILYEILTGKRILNAEDIRLYLKDNIVKGNTKQLMACAELVVRCVDMNMEERPSMMEAAKELRRIARFQQ
ncbi:hypothetical protein HHK36_022302 [Tetracentron sinense]|uniref:Protein kinase domain-containing protein n=1 Tax=Tetracentron sinense TaxID=13715 RepID=A0A834YPB6_TETSI|nr:hypothetical protein HHK36_022302 [Tetracentron sinense]